MRATWRAAGILLLILSAFYWKVTLTGQFDWMWSPDLALQVLPWYEEEARQMRQGTFPLWDSHVWAGQPLLAQAQPGAVYPLNWIVFAWPAAKNGHIHRDLLSWYFVAIHFMAAMFLYALCRDLGRSQTASILGGLIFALSSYFGDIQWPQMLNGAVWAPLVLLFLLRAISQQPRPWRNAVLAGCFLGISWLSGHHQAPVFLSMAVVGVLAFHVFRGSTSRIQKGALAGLVMGMAGLVGALQILPAMEYGRLSVRWVSASNPVHWNEAVPYSVHEQFRLFPIDLFGVVFPGIGRHTSPFVGICALVVALAGLIIYWRRLEVKILSAIGLGAVIFALGSNSVFHGFLYTVFPMVEKARSPTMALFLFSTAIAVLAAFGVDSLRENVVGPVWGTRLTQWTAWFGALTFLVLGGVFLSLKLRWDFDDRLALTPWIALLLAGLLAAWRKGHLSHRSAPVLLCLLILLELGNSFSTKIVRRDDPDLKGIREKIVNDPEIAQFLYSQTKPFRIDLATERLAPNWPQFQNLDGLGAYTASLTTNDVNLEWTSPPTKSLLGARYSIAEKPPAPEYRDVFTAKSGLKVYQNPGAFPRAWSVHRAIRISSTDEGRGIIYGRLNELRNAALTTTDIPGMDSSCDGSGDTASFRSLQPDRVSLSVRMGCGGMLVLSDTYYPGWTAQVDGRTAKIYEVDLSLRGVPVPVGTHEVLFTYRPASVYAGGALTLIGLMGTLGFVMSGRRA